jgi:ABC-type hemin transport system substrate-binding protein
MHSFAQCLGLVPCVCVVLLQEAQAKDSITQLKAEIANLTRLAEAGSALSSGDEAALNELMKQKEELTRERDTQVCWVMHDICEQQQQQSAQGGQAHNCAGARAPASEL